MTHEALSQLAQEVTDEKSFVRFLTALREDCESSEHDCESREADCVENNHWQTRSTKNFLRSMEDWSQGDFVDGEHGAPRSSAASPPCSSSASTCATRTGRRGRGGRLSGGSV